MFLAVVVAPVTTDAASASEARILVVCGLIHPTMSRFDGPWFLSYGESIVDVEVGKHCLFRTVRQVADCVTILLYSAS